jgi:hypothetical protein
MPYLVVSDFSAGLDLRKSAVTAPAGTLRELVNAHITPGGEIEKRKAFAEKSQLPSDCFGLAFVRGETYTFRDAATVSVTAAADYSIIDLVSANANELVELSDWDIFDGDLYLSVRDSGGVIQHFFPTTPGAHDYAHVNNSRAQSPTIRTYRSKVHGVDGRNLNFSAVENPAQYDDAAPDGTGAGFINLSNQDADSDDLVALEVYYDTLAVMSKRAIQIWQIDPDPAQNSQIQVLRAAGTEARRSLKQFGSGDVLYLAQTGIRSLRARDSSNAAAVSDIGSPIDSYIRDMARDNTAAYMQSAIGIIEPVSNRFWMVFPDKILVLSSFPSPKVTAWSTYIPEFEIESVVVGDDEVLLLSTDKKLYSYGAETYDACEASALMPFLTADQPATNKFFIGVDVACDGRWDIYARFNPANENAEDLVARVTESTFTSEHYGMEGHSTHVAIRMATNDSKASTLAHVVLHFAAGASG